MTSFVVDASVAVQWVISEQNTSQALSLMQGHALHAPAHWLAEACNTIWNKERRGDIEAGAGADRIATLCTAPVTSAPLLALAQSPSDTATACMISVHGAFYVVLARSLGARLVTADVKLLRALRRAGMNGHVSIWVGSL